MKSINQKGFSAVIVLLILLLLVAVGFTGYFVWNTQSKNIQDIPIIEKTSSNDSTKNSSLVESCLTAEPICIKYPSELKAKITNYPAGEGSPYDSQKLEIQTEKGSVFLIKTGVEGLGGVCEEPAGNENTIKIVKSEQSKIDKSLYVSLLADSNNNSNNYNNKIWLISTSQQNPTIQPGMKLGCSNYYDMLHKLNGFQHMTRIEANTVDSSENDLMFEIFQSIKIN